MHAVNETSSSPSSEGGCSIVRDAKGGGHTTSASNTPGGAVDTFEHDAPHWSARMAFIAAGFRPATLAGRTNHVSLKRAYAVHFVAFLLTVVIVITAVIYEEHYPLFTVDALAHAFAAGVGSIFNGIASDQWNTTGDILVVATGVEVGLLILALMGAPWGAHDERLRDSYRHSLRRVLLHSAIAPPIAIFIAVISVPLLITRSLWLDDYPGLPLNPPTVSQTILVNGSPQTSPEWATYWKECDEWYKERERSKPFVVRHSTSFIVNTAFFCVGWFLWSMLRGVGARRHVPRIDRPPMCEGCGYNLSTIPMQSRCPECGRPVVESLGPEVRLGTPWEHRAQVGRFAAWWRCAFDSVFRSGRLGGAMRMSLPVPGHRRLLAAHLPFIWMIGALTIPAVLYVIGQLEEFWSDPDILTVAIPTFGLIATLTALGLTLLTPAVIGWVISMREKRNLWSAAARTACYLSTYMVLWVLIASLNGVWMLGLADSGFFKDLQESYGIPPEVSGTLSWLVPNCTLGIIYLILIVRGTSASRYANR